MISIFSSTFSFSSPLWLLAIPLGLAILVYAYLRHGRGEKLVVPTLFILQKLKRTASSRKNFVPPPRFFFELLLLSLLIAGGAGLYLQEEGQKIAVLIDNSFSMKAADPSSGQNKTLFSEAIERASLELSSEPSSSTAKIFSTSPALREINPEFEPVADALELLNEIKPEYAPDNLGPSLHRILSMPGIQKILVFSDKQPTPDKSPISQTQVVFNSIAPVTRPQNVALTDIYLANNASSSSKKVLKASVVAYSRSPVEATLEADSLKADGASLERIAEKQIHLEPLVAQSVEFDALLDNFSALRVSLTTRSENSIKEDDQAWITSEGQRSSVLLVSSYSPEQLGFSKIPSLHAISLKPNEYQTKVGANNSFYKKEGISSAIFHRFIPEGLPPVNSLFVLPPQENKLIQVLPQAVSPQITKWDDSHPLNTYLNYPALSLKTIFPLITPSWGMEVLGTTAGTAIVAGEKTGLRYAFTGFEIFPYEGRNSPLLSIFFLNSIKWLSGSEAKGNSFSTWNPIQVEADDEVSYWHGDQLSPQKAKDKEHPIVVPEKPGLIEISGSGGQKQIIAINFFSPEESNTLEAIQVTLPSATNISEQQSDKYFLAKEIALGVLVLVLLDLLLGIVRGQLGVRK